MTSIVAARPDARELSDPGRARMWAAARDFEAMVLGQLIAPMMATVDTSKSAMGGGAAEAQWRPMLAQEMGKHVGKAGGLGLAVPVYRQMIRNQEAADAMKEMAGE